MEIKTGNGIYLSGLDVIEANRNTGYSDETIKLRKEFESKRWIAVDDLIVFIKGFQSKKKQITDKIIIQEELKEALIKELSNSRPKK